jgi:hypothetical protein
LQNVLPDLYFLTPGIGAGGDLDDVGAGRGVEIEIYVPGLGGLYGSCFYDCAGEIGDGGGGGGWREGDGKGAGGGIGEYKASHFQQRDAICSFWKTYNCQ